MLFNIEINAFAAMRVLDGKKSTCTRATTMSGIGVRLMNLLKNKSLVTIEQIRTTLKERKNRSGINV